MTDVPGFHCEVCDQWHDELHKDFGFELPDAVWGLDYIETYRRTRHNKDVCVLDEARYFIRCMLEVPLTYDDDHFGFGLWVEVSQDQHELYLDTWQSGSDQTEAFVGHLANDLPMYPALVGEPIMIKFYDQHRPLLNFPAIADHPLAQEQRSGIDLRRHHALIG